VCRLGDVTSMATTAGRSGRCAAVGGGGRHLRRERQCRPRGHSRRATDRPGIVIPRRRKMELRRTKVAAITRPTSPAASSNPV